MHFAVRNSNELLLTTVIEIDVKTEGSAINSYFIKYFPREFRKRIFKLIEEVNEEFQIYISKSQIKVKERMVLKFNILAPSSGTSTVCRALLNLQTLKFNR